MGLLDDAIREHLDLKRQHGASDDEIAQKEAEALGPARREFPRTAEEDVPVDEAPALVDDESFHTLGDPFEDEIAEPPVFEPPAAPEPTSAPRAELADTEEYRFEDEELEEDEEEVEVDDDDEVELDDDDLDLDDDDDEEDEDEDLLGDTPEFLQDTPEHDRLWFEQKPPRDFDFE